MRWVELVVTLKRYTSERDHGADSDSGCVLGSMLYQISDAVLISRLA